MSDTMIYRGKDDYAIAALNNQHALFDRRTKSLLDLLLERITNALRRFQASGDTGIGVTKSD